MELDRTQCEEYLRAADHGVLATLHPERGVDAVPVCFVLGTQWVAVPVDTVKAKRSPKLQRVRNLELDPRATLVVEHWDRSEWSQLWWVRASLAFRAPAPTGANAEQLLREKYPQYLEAPFMEILTFDVTSVFGWSATG
jgi:hypothetical protein